MRDLPGVLPMFEGLVDADKINAVLLFVLKTSHVCAAFLLLKKACVRLLKCSSGA